MTTERQPVDQPGDWTGWWQSGDAGDLTLHGPGGVMVRYRREGWNLNPSPRRKPGQHPWIALRQGRVLEEGRKRWRKFATAAAARDALCERGGAP